MRRLKVLKDLMRLNAPLSTIARAYAMCVRYLVPTSPLLPEVIALGGKLRQDHPEFLRCVELAIRAHTMEAVGFCALPHEKTGEPCPAPVVPSGYLCAAHQAEVDRVEREQDAWRQTPEGQEYALQLEVEFAHERPPEKWGQA